MTSHAHEALTPHSRTILDTLRKSRIPLSAYALLEQLRDTGIKAPPTVYRALDRLMEQGYVHRIETINAFIACHRHGAEHRARFAVCRACNRAEELHDTGQRLSASLAALTSGLRFTVERETLELIGICHRCQTEGRA